MSGTFYRGFDLYPSVAGGVIAVRRNAQPNRENVLVGKSDAEVRNAIDADTDAHKSIPPK